MDKEKDDTIKTTFRMPKGQRRKVLARGKIERRNLSNMIVELIDLGLDVKQNGAQYGR